MGSGTQVEQGLVKLVVRARWARGVLLAYLLAVALTVPISASVTLMVSTFGLSPDYVALFLTGCLISGLALFIGQAITIPLWIYRAWANLHAMRLQGLEYSPGWAAGSVFVPIAGLIVPFRAMRQLANRSFGEEEYHANTSVADVTSWWACYLGGIFVQLAMLGIAIFNSIGWVNNRLMVITAPEPVRLLTAAFGIALMLGAAWFLRKVIGEITAAQTSFTAIEDTFA
ncbi:MAG: DUF4328 domain-containing protein [Proteobacteria bacterium]|nr:MAG: DUF4328 domain-containing protein [Pseudomonadota bacterium]